MKFIYWLLLFVSFLVLVTGIIVLVAILTESEEKKLCNKNRELFELSIIHFSDFHARFDEINEKTLLPCDNDDEKEVCIGGIARMKTVIDQLIAKRKNAIVLNGGDNFQGTIWYNLLRHNVTSHFMNLLPIDVNVLGNHEFAHGVDGLIPFLESLNSPTVVANLDGRRQQNFHNLKIKKSIVIERSARKIGIIGVMLREIPNAENLKFTDEIDAIRNESTKLRQSGVNIIVVLSHCGLDKDKIIALECGDYVDVIVGGHSHSLLYTANDDELSPDAMEIPLGPYPLVLTPKSGKNRKVLIVHASAFSKYIGDLRIYFNSAGAVKYYDGNAIYLGNEVIKDQLIEEELVPWRNDVEKLGKRVVGSTSLDLIHTECRHGECLLGNFVTDAFVSANHSIKHVYTAIIQAGGIRNGLYRGNIHYSDIIAMLPFEDTLDVLELRGDTLYEIFEHSVSRSYAENEFIGIHMLQVSGFKVTFNTTKAVGERVHSVKIKITDAEYENVQLNKLYTVIVPCFLADGGDGFTMMIKSVRKNKSNGLKLLDIDVIEAYIKYKSPITDGIITDEHQRVVMLT